MRRLGKSLHRLLGRARGDQRRGPRRMQQPLGVQIVGIGVAGALARQHANAAPGAGSLAGRLHDLLVHAQRDGRNRLEVKVGIVAAGGQSLAQAALQKPLGDAKFLEKIALVAGVWGRKLGVQSSYFSVYAESCGSPPLWASSRYPFLS